MGRIMHCAPSVCVLTARRSHLGQTPQTNYMAGARVSAFSSAIKPPRLSACQVRCMLCAEAFAYCRSHEALAVSAPIYKTLNDYTYQWTTRGRV